MQRALSKRNPKAVWQVIHRVLKPNPQPLRQDPDSLNSYFCNIAERTVNATNKTIEELHAIIDSLEECGNNFCTLRPVAYHEVLREIKSLRSDCSTGPDQIPAKFIKLVAEDISSPLTHIINCCIEKEHFPSAWKLARTSPIPKINNPTTNNDLRGISILPVLSKVYEKLVLRQMAEFIDSKHLLPSHMSGFRKGHSTTTALINIRDDIIKAMNRGEVTIMVFADFSKAFDTVHFDIIIRKLHLMGFSTQFLRWMMSYLTERQQYVQIDDKKSGKLYTNFGVPQGSILGLVLFNLYVADLADELGTVCNCHQYADDTTIYNSVKPKDFQLGVEQMNNSLTNLTRWSDESKLALNNNKTKAMLITTPQMANYHSLRTEGVMNIFLDNNNNNSCNNNKNNKFLEVMESYKLLGVHLSNTFRWDKHINETVSSCYASLAILRKLRNMAPFDLRKRLAETLILSKLDYSCDLVFYPLPAKLLKRLQRVQSSAACFVTGKFSKEDAVLKLGWLPMLERRDWHLLKTAFKALNYDHWPEYAKLKLYNPGRSGLRSCSKDLLETPIDRDIFQYSAAKCFNKLPQTLRAEKNFETFCAETRVFLFDQARERLG